MRFGSKFRSIFSDTQLNPSHLAIMDTTQGMKWEPLIGAFIMNFGAVEMASFQWITALSADPVVLRDLAIDMQFRKRISLVCQLIERSATSAEQKAEAVGLWEEVAKLAEIRNTIAHSPFVSQPSEGFINVKKLKGDGPYELKPLGLVEIASAGSRLARILPKILTPFGRSEPGAN
jgi:hypothetical protein